MVDRRLLLFGGVAALGIAGVRWLDGSDVEAASTFEIDKTDSEWRRILTRPQYDVLRLHRTEIPGSSPLNHEKRKGTFACAGCDLPLFASETKFESGTGWPSFYRPLANAVGTRDRPRRSCWRAPRCIAAAAAAISAMSSRTGRSRPGCAIA